MIQYTFCECRHAKRTGSTVEVLAAGVVICVLAFAAVLALVGFIVWLFV